MKRTFEEYERERVELVQRLKMMSRDFNNLAVQINEVEHRISDIGAEQKKIARKDNENAESNNPNLDNMPCEIIEMITGHLRHKDVVNLWKVNSILRAKIDHKQFFYKFVGDSKCPEQKLPLDSKAVIGATNYIYHNLPCMLLRVNEMIGEKTREFVCGKIGIGKFDVKPELTFRKWDDGLVTADHEVKSLFKIAEVLGKNFKHGIMPRNKKISIIRTAGKVIVGPHHGVHDRSSVMRCYVFCEKELTGEMYIFKSPVAAARPSDVHLDTKGNLRFTVKGESYRYSFKKLRLRRRQKSWMSESNIRSSKNIFKTF